VIRDCGFLSWLFPPGHAELGRTRARSRSRKASSDSSVFKLSPDSAFVDCDVEIGLQPGNDRFIGEFIEPAMQRSELLFSEGLELFGKLEGHGELLVMSYCLFGLRTRMKKVVLHRKDAGEAREVKPVEALRQRP
jgi:hypothetical protein